MIEVGAVSYCEPGFVKRIDLICPGSNSASANSDSPSPYIASEIRIELFPVAEVTVIVGSKCCSSKHN